MTPLPKPKPTFYRTQRDNPTPMTASQYLRWKARHRRQALTPPDPRPFWLDTVGPAGGGRAGDEIDAGYLGAIRQSPRLVGTADGQVPLEVARRLYGLGLIRKVG